MSTEPESRYSPMAESIYDDKMSDLIWLYACLRAPEQESLRDAVLPSGQYPTAHPRAVWLHPGPAVLAVHDPPGVIQALKVSYALQ